MKIVWGMKIVWLFLGGGGGHHKKWASLRVITLNIRVFFKVKLQIWNIFLGC